VFHGVASWDDTLVRFHVVVKGVVQGVGYRFYAHDRACKLGLLGYARNRMDGTVEVEVEGDEAVVKGFIEELRLGPRSAHVTGIEMERLEGGGNYNGFEIRF
jgi:acylphosphatase